MFKLLVIFAVCYTTMIENMLKSNFCLLIMITEF